MDTYSYKSYDKKIRILELLKELYNLMARGIKESRFFFSGGSFSLPRTLPWANSASCRG